MRLTTLFVPLNDKDELAYTLHLKIGWAGIVKAFLDDIGIFRQRAYVPAIELLGRRLNFRFVITASR